MKAGCWYKNLKIVGLLLYPIKVKYTKDGSLDLEVEWWKEDPVSKRKMRTDIVQTMFIPKDEIKLWIQV
jgi:hypothetical protein